MIATRLHAKRHSNLAAKRPSVASIPSSVHFHTQQQQQLRRASKRPSHDIQNIDSDEHSDPADDDDNDVHERVKVDVRFLLPYYPQSSAWLCVVGSRDSRVVNVISSLAVFIDHFRFG